MLTIASPLCYTLNMSLLKEAIQKLFLRDTINDILTSKMRLQITRRSCLFYKRAKSIIHINSQYPRTTRMEEYHVMG